MKTYIDVSCLYAVPYVSGIQRVVIEVCCGLIARKHDVELFVDEGSTYYRVVDNVRFYNYYKLGKGEKEDLLLSNRKKYSNIKSNGILFDIDAVWNPFCKERNVFYADLKRKGVKIYTFIHDLIPLKWPDTVDDMLLFRYMNYINAVFSNADVILNQTQSGVAAIKQLMEKQSYKKVPCYHTWLGADFGKKQKNKDNIDETVKKIIGSRFILMTGTLEVRKNHKVVLDAFDKYLFAKGFKLVFVGREDWRNEEFLQRVLQHERINKDLYFLNRLNDESLDILYKNAFMLAFPSYDEGFGLPIVEALVRGTPVITADIDVMREVGGSLAIYFKQDDVEDLTKNILFYVDNKEAYNELCKKISDYKPKTWEYVIDNMEKILYLKDNKK